ncbi:hypothetical protein Calow_0818 [Caldicellulosiruptor owensensis OL]|uniref:Uncharacterized protein n=1 Tax=Caldicellulosiruptor owensensis (strain ATCC 700167 / DSM 13100 / OL) TaxID=632518 RepID=E4Q612_CALOW|nr:hypothetical protein [Caldicellulosiruptor owensensis]ADQ04386.1 hypothetical protein Calow_0818 [Caldicellulosiruptor owensensis OL]
MATYRQIYISYWQDSYILDLEPEGKLLYMYFMTNSRTTQCGIYELPLKIIQFETGLDKKTIESYIKKFIQDKKILYSWETNEIFLLNWLKYNNIDSPKTLACVKKELTNVKNKEYVMVFLQIAESLKYPIDELKEEFVDIANTPSVSLVYPLDTPSIPLGEEKYKEEEEEKKEIYKEDILSSDDDGSASEKQTKKESLVMTVDEFVESYNSICKSLPKVMKLTENRRKKIRNLIKNIRDRTLLITGLQKVEESDFLSGRSGKWTGCNIDWIIKTNNFLKILEGVYDNKAGKEDDNNGTSGRSNKQDDPYAGIGLTF